MGVSSFNNTENSPPDAFNLHCSISGSIKKKKRSQRRRRRYPLQDITHLFNFHTYQPNLSSSPPNIPVLRCSRKRISAQVAEDGDEELALAGVSSVLRKEFR